MKNVPNILTCLRLLSAPVLVAAFLLLSGGLRDTVTAALFIVIMLTDLLDGYIARRFGSTSRLGEFLDPVADKIVVITALLLLLDAGRAPVLAVLIIVGREICVLGLREWMANIGKGRLLTPALPGKSKTAFQMTAVVLLFYRQPLLGLPTMMIGEVLLWIAAVFTIVSMLFYLRAAAAAWR